MESKKAEYKEEPLFQINKDIEAKLKKNYKKTLETIFSNVSKKIIKFAK